MTTHALRVALAIAMISGGDAIAQPVEDPPAPPVQEITPDDPTPPPKQPAPAPLPTIAPAAPVHTMEDVTIPKSFLRFGFNFFGDTSFVATTPDAPHSAFAIGTLGVRLLGELSPSLDALAELGFETTSTGPVADVEQVAIRWRKGPGQLEVGRVHTDLGYWNTAYHHGLWLQIPIARPHVVRFEDDGGLVPVHWVGAQYALTGKLGGGTGRVVLGVGNGRGRNVDDIRVSDDTNDAKSVLLKLRYKTPIVELGVGGIYDVIAPEPALVRPALANQRIHELVGNAYVVVRGDGPIVIGEAYVLHHQASSKTTTTVAGYGLLGFAVTDWLTPYVAIDVVDGADDDPFFVPDPMLASPIDVVEGIVGARFETTTWSALKLELQYRSQPGDDAGQANYTAAVNWSFGL